MTIIDRYLLRQFLQTFVICFVSLTGLYIVIDGFGNLEEFITYSRTHGSLLWVMGEYYAYRSLSFFDVTSGILMLISAMFTLTWIQRHNELTAIESAGISKARVIKPLVAAVVVISLLSAANRELGIPACRDQLSHNAQDLGGTAGKELQPRYDYQTDILFHRGETFADKLRIHKPEFRLPQTISLDSSSLTAENAYYYSPDGDRPGGYLLMNVAQPKNIDQVASIDLGDEPVILTSYDTPWLKPGECFLVSDVSFEQLEGGNNWRRLSSTMELIGGLRNRSLDFGADVRVAIHSRLVQPLLDLTLLFLGVPLVLARGNRNVFMAIGLCVGVAVAFMLVVIGCQALGSGSLLHPALAAWLPLMIFVPIAVGLSDPLYA